MRHISLYICDPNFSCGLTEPHPATDGDQQSLSPDTQNHNLLQVSAQVITYSTHFVLLFISVMVMKGRMWMRMKDDGVVLRGSEQQMS